MGNLQPWRRRRKWEEKKKNETLLLYLLLLFPKQHQKQEQKQQLIFMGSLLGNWPSYDPHNFSQLRPSDPAHPSVSTLLRFQTHKHKMDVYDHTNGLMPSILGDIVCLPMVLRAAIDLKVFEIIADAGPEAILSPSEMVTKMPTSNPHAATSLERLLRVLVTNKILTMSVRSDGKGGVPEHLYGLTDQSRFLVPDKDGVTAAPIARLFLDRVTMESLFYLKDAVIEGGRTPFEMAHGVDIFGFGSKDPRYNNVFQEGMSNSSVIATKEIFKVYKGFNEVKQLMDVGGGTGTCISSIVSHFPQIRGSNFDLPHVIESAPQWPGVEHVGGNMFEGVPSAETIFMKFVLHDWDDDHCVKLLKNCWNALPDGGKVINVEFVVPSVLGTDAVSRQTAVEDLLMMACSPGGKERTAAEYDNLAKAAGFAETKDIPISLGIHVIEFYKRISLKN